MSSCMECGKGFSAKRKDAKFCSGACRSNSCQKRKRQIVKADGRSKDMFIVQDMNKISAIHPDARSYLEKLDVLFGKQALILAIEAIAATGVPV